MLSKLNIPTSKRAFIIVSLLTVVLFSNAQIKMMVTSDPHVMARELYDVPYGEAFLEAMHHDLKVVEDSQKLFEDFCKKVISNHPDILLIPGDLTKDGEKVSHMVVAKNLDEVRKAGIKVYVIPGNHDMENPLARRYRGTEATTEPSITEKEFVDMYYDNGYSEAVMTDSLTNSYMVYPAKGLAIVCINSVIPNKYERRYVHGRISHNLLMWAAKAARNAKEDHRVVIGMMHHEILEHHNQESTFAPTAMVNMEKIKEQPSIQEVRNALRLAGIEVVITGHYHIQSIKSVVTPHGNITDITTGSLSGFPSAYRYLDLNAEKGELKVTSANMFGTKTNKWPQTFIAKKEWDRLRYMVQLYVPKIPNRKTNMGIAYDYLAKSFDAALCALAAGDEKGHSPKNVIDACMKAFDEYVSHVLLYNFMEINNLKQDKNGPYARLRDLMTSIMYNYVGNNKNSTPDNSYKIKLQNKSGGI